MFDDAPRLSLPDETGRRLRTILENRLLQRFIDRVDTAAPDDDSVFKIAAVLCDIRKQDAAAEKNHVALFVARNKPAPPRRTTDMTARSAADAQVPKSEIRNPESEMTHETLARAVREIYGITDLPRCTPRPETRNDEPTEQVQQNHEKRPDRAPNPKSKIESPKSPTPTLTPHAASTSASTPGSQNPALIDRNPKSKIENPKSLAPAAIPQSAIRNPHSAFRRPHCPSPPPTRSGEYSADAPAASDAKSTIRSISRPWMQVVAAGSARHILSRARRRVRAKACKGGGKGM